MEGILVNERVKSVAVSVTKTVAITLSFAALYVMFTELSPVMAKSSFAGLFFGKTLRFANMLRAFSLVTPLAAIGTHLGAMSMDFGNPTDMLAPHGYINTFMGLGVFYFVKRYGRSMVKDLTLLGIFGLLSGLVVTLSKAGLAAIFGGEMFRILVGQMIWFKMLSSMVIYMSGYLLVKSYDTLKGDN